jgi:3-dehydroquinate dehydratase-2
MPTSSANYPNLPGHLKIIEAYSKFLQPYNFDRSTTPLSSIMAKLLVLNGPNLNLLGVRETNIYGSTGLEDIVRCCQAVANDLGHDLIGFQSNAEHELLDRVHEASRAGVDFIILNPAALTHTSIGLRDALLGVEIPFIEVHLSNVFARESFRHRSYLSDIAIGVISGLGAQGYELAVQAADRYLSSHA